MRKALCCLTFAIVLIMSIGFSIGVVQAGPCKLPDFGAASFTAPQIINNPYFPLIPGTTFLYEPKPNEDNVVNTVVVTGTKNILGIDCVEVHDFETVSGELTEDTLDWYAQDDDGNVWYFGEDSKKFCGPNCVDTTGSWEAGKNGALPGYLVLAEPRPGVCYQQESAEGAQDRAKVLRLNAKVILENGESDKDCLKTKEWTAFDYQSISIVTVLQFQQNPLTSIDYALNKHYEIYVSLSLQAGQNKTWPLLLAFPPPILFHHASLQSS